MTQTLIIHPTRQMAGQPPKGSGTASGHARNHAVDGTAPETRRINRPLILAGYSLTQLPWSMTRNYSFMMCSIFQVARP
jgi:hypothetical protein